MSPVGWLRPSKPRRQERNQNRFRPGLKLLEDRCVPATFIINATDDTSAVDLVTGLDANDNISLRSALEAA